MTALVGVAVDDIHGLLRESVLFLDAPFGLGLKETVALLVFPLERRRFGVPLFVDSCFWSSLSDWGFINPVADAHNVAFVPPELFPHSPDAAGDMDAGAVEEAFLIAARELVLFQTFEVSSHDDSSPFRPRRVQRISGCTRPGQATWY